MNSKIFSVFVSTCIFLSTCFVNSRADIYLSNPISDNQRFANTMMCYVNIFDWNASYNDSIGIFSVEVKGSCVQGSVGNPCQFLILTTTLKKSGSNFFVVQDGCSTIDLNCGQTTIINFFYDCNLLGPGTYQTWISIWNGNCDNPGSICYDSRNYEYVSN